MAYQLCLPTTQQFALYGLLLWTLILQAVITQTNGTLAELVNAAPPNIVGRNQLPPPPIPMRVCQSREVRTMSDFQSLRNCTRITGFVRLAYIPTEITGNETPAITSAVEEISDYLLVYRSHGLQSLAQIFPKLKVIRGLELLFNEFALVVYENRELSNLGLGSLLRIQRGNIRIQSNPSLCYVETINWVQLLGNSTQQHFYHKNNKPNSHCTICSRTARNEADLPEKLRHHCWSLNMQQLRPATSSLANCSSDCGIRGCDDNGKCCDHNCLNGCDGANCTFCANLSLNGECVNVCPQNTFQYQKRVCLTADKCQKSGAVPHAGLCVEKCPAYHALTFNRFGELYCKLNCNGNFVMHNAHDIESLTGCTTINGSITIELTDIKVKITDLEHAFRNVTEITGYLKVVNSPQLLSLHFLPNLISICGQQLIDDLYALYVVDNYHLSDIWTTNQKVDIRNGSIYFHLNPRLCLYKIFDLEESIKDAKPLTNINVSPHSNGERVICNSYLKELNTTVEDFNSTAARIKIDMYTKNNIQIILGYVYFYKEAPIKNVTLYDGRHGCGHDHWHMALNPSQNLRVIIPKLKPYTQYAYFVKTITIVDYHIRADAYSKIQYFRTLPSKPGPVRKLHYAPINADTLMLHWWSPQRPNGEIEKYLIRYEKVDPNTQNLTFSGHPDVLKNSIECDCEETDPELSGPLPEDENFYNRDKFVYEEALPNLMYSKVGDKRRIHRDVSSVGQLSNTSNAINALFDTTTKRLRKTRKINDKEAQPPTEIEDKVKSEKNKTIDDAHSFDGDARLQAIIKNLKEFYKHQEEIAVKAQDTGPHDFRILKPRPVCPMPDASLQYQLQNNCQPMETYEGIEVEGHIHSYKLSGLETYQRYSISVRACVAHLDNACGPETSIYAETMSVQQYILTP